MAKVIDVDRGVSMRQVVKFDKANPSKFMPDPAYGGMYVYMYKDDPGKYYDVHHRLLPEGIAKMAGFDVDTHAKARKFKEADEAFKEEMRKQLGMDSPSEVILAQSGNWKVVELPMQRAKIVDIETGEAVTPVPMPQSDALALLKNLAGPEEVVQLKKEK